MDSKILEILNSKLNSRVQDISESLASGAAKDFAEYQRLCGLVTGLLTAQREIQDLAQKMKDNDED